MKVAIIFDGASALGQSADLLILEAVEAIEAALADDGHQAIRLPINPDARWMERLRRGKFDLVFNLAEAVDGDAFGEPSVLRALELIGVPFTGSSAWTAALCLRKHFVNALLERAGLPVPRFEFVRPGGAVPSVGFPAICKPAAEDASVGIEQRSVVRTAAALRARLDRMHERWDEVLVQRYVDGREVNVGILGDRPLPIAEINFGQMPRGMWRIVSYRSKWIPGSDEDLGAEPICPAELSDELAAELARVALAAWRLVGGEGYGRADFRIDKAGRPWLLEVNANPDLSPDAGLARMARTAGYDFTALIREICAEAFRRRGMDGSSRWELARELSGIDSVDDAPVPIDLRASSAPRG